MQVSSLSKYRIQSIRRCLLSLGGRHAEVSALPVHTFNTDLHLGDQNADVLALQQILSYDDCFNLTPTGYFADKVAREGLIEVDRTNANAYMRRRSTASAHASLCDSRS